MVRDVTDDKIDYTLALDGPMFKRLAIHLTKGAQKYAKRNWMKARGEEELNRFKESATRHFMQWLNGDTDEDHAAAVIFNINGAEYVKERFDDWKAVETLRPAPGTQRFGESRPLPITQQYLEDDGA